MHFVGYAVSAGEPAPVSPKRPVGTNTSSLQDDRRGRRLSGRHLALSRAEGVLSKCNRAVLAAARFVFIWGQTQQPLIKTGSY